MKKVLKNINWLRVSGSLVMFIIGVLLVIFTDEILHIICYVMGIATIFLVAVRVAVLLRSKKLDVYDISIAVILAIVGVLLLLAPSVELSWFVSLVFGLILIIDGASKLQDGIAFYRLSVKNWRIDLIVAILCVILGMLVIINPFTTQKLLMLIIGCGLIFDAAYSIAGNVLCAIKISKGPAEKNDGGNFHFTDL